MKDSSFIWKEDFNLQTAFPHDHKERVLEKMETKNSYWIL